MVCYHPKVAFNVGVKPNGKMQLAFAKSKYQQWYIDNKGKEHHEFERLLLPCGKCLGCKMKYSQDWAIRMVHELEYHDDACFITLTYDNDHVPRSLYVDENGEVKESLTLRKRDFQLFMKRFRQQLVRLGYENKIRFYAAGEYGEETKRPHYHSIIFGFDFRKIGYVYKSEKGYDHYRSDLLEQLWPYGMSEICEVNMNTCAYVARYCTKKRFTKRNIYYQTLNIEPEFSDMSRRPGIGAKWIEEHIGDLYPDGDIFMSTNKKGYKFKPPKFYDKYYEIYEPDAMADIKKKRKEKAERSMQQKLENNNVDMFTLLEAEERELTRKTSSLLRKEC